MSLIIDDIWECKVCGKYRGNVWKIGQLNLDVCDNHSHSKFDYRNHNDTQIYKNIANGRYVTVGKSEISDTGITLHYIRPISKSSEYNNDKIIYDWFSDWITEYDLKKYWVLEKGEEEI